MTVVTGCPCAGNARPRASTSQTVWYGFAMALLGMKGLHRKTCRLFIRNLEHKAPPDKWFKHMPHVPRLQSLQRLLVWLQASVISCMCSLYSLLPTFAVSLWLSYLKRQECPKDKLQTNFKLLKFAVTPAVVKWLVKCNYNQQDNRIFFTSRLNKI